MSEALIAVKGGQVYAVTLNDSQPDVDRWILERVREGAAVLPVTCAVARESCFEPLDLILRDAQGKERAV